MATFLISTILLATIFSTTLAANFNVINNCPYTVWAAASPGGGRQLANGQSWSLDVSPGTTQARIWARTNCAFDAAGNGRCETGDCGGVLECRGYGQAPNTLAEFALNQYMNQDFIDISNIDGFNVPMEFSSASPGCSRVIKCKGNIIGECPNELKVPGGCNGPCPMLKTEEHCCNSGNCGPTNLSRFFKERCPDAYSYRPSHPLKSYKQNRIDPPSRLLLRPPPMAFSSGGKSQLLFLTLLSLLLLAAARLNLDPSDLKAFSIIHKDLGLQLHAQQDTCNTPGVYCERRLSNNTNTYVLRITRLLFKSQQLGGFLSPAIGQLSELRELSLPNNQLVDQLPSQLAGCRKLEILDLRNNRFSGELPLQLSSLVRLRILDLSSNQFSGKLSFLKYFPNLENLSLADNLFSGTIPQSIRSFRNLQVFNISGNDFLEGPVPVMSRVKLSATHLPKRYIFAETNSTRRSNSSFSAAAFAPSNAAAPAPGPSAAHHRKKDKRKKLAGWLLGFLAGGVAGSISGLIFSLMFKLILAAIKGGGKDHGPDIYSPLIKKAEDLAFLENDDGFAALEMIGKGGCGEVYKAELPGSDGKIIAIKKIIQPSKDAAELADEDTKDLHKKMRQIKSEIQTVGQIRHRNLLPLLAHVSRPDCHYLVYEFMKNGSLQDMLNQVSAGHRELDWLARHKIAVGVAAGLEYLHMNHSPRIIHRDLKPANVLLDDDMEARIADFGLAKAMPDAQTHITTSNVAGTVGYIAPEYHQTLKFTDKCDIYSFGVLLGVLVMGKLPSDDFFQHTTEMSLIKWMRNVMTSENPYQAIDEKLAGNGFEEQMLLVLKIACFCTLEDPKQRPNSKDVRCMLTQIIH